MNPPSALVLRSDRSTIAIHRHPHQTGASSSRSTTSQPSASLSLPPQICSPEGSSPSQPPKICWLSDQPRPPASSGGSTISEDDYQTGSSDSIATPEKASSDPATDGDDGDGDGDGDRVVLACMGSIVSRAQARESDGHPVQPPEQRSWSLALTTQPHHLHSAITQDYVYQPDSATQTVSTIIDRSTKRAGKTMDSLSDTKGNPFPAGERSFSGLVVSDSHPMTKQKPSSSADLPKQQDQTKRENADEKLSASARHLHPLESLERSLPHRATLSLWVEEERLLQLRIEKKEALRVSDERDVYLILGLNFLFQAILVSGTAQASALDCHSYWIPLTMSLIVSMAAFLAALRKLGEMEEILCQLHACKVDARVLLQYIEKLRSLGDLFDLMDLPHLTSTLTKGRRSYFSGKLNILCSLKSFVLLILFLFSVITFVSFRRILCHH